MNRIEKMYFVKADELYNQLHKATTTDKRYYYLNSIIALMEKLPALQDYFILREAHRIVNRIYRAENFPSFSLEEVPRFNDVIDRESEKALRKIPGLYFIGEITYNPELKMPLYWVKIGTSTVNLCQRVHGYDTHCPTTWRIDFRDNPRLEGYYHKLLGACCIDRATGCEEWFRVDEETYFEMCAKGFSYFD